MGALELRDVSFRYATGHRDAVSEVTLTVQPGELCAVVGANGSGKTTLCNIVRGFAPRFFTGELTGEVLVHGEPVADIELGVLATRMGFVFQNPFVQISGSTDTVYEEVAFGLENLGVDLAEIRDRVERTMARVGIEQLRDKNPVELSGGQKQRVALASTLAMEPEIMIIDEPTSQLDPQGTAEVFDIITMLKESGTTILLVEHKMELIAEHADSVAVLDQGRLVLHGPAEQVLADPRLAEHQVAAPQYALLGAALRRAGARTDRNPVTRAAAVEMCRAVREGRGGARDGAAGAA